MIVRGVHERDYEQRFAFTERMFIILEGNDDAAVMMIDEAHFYFNGTIVVISQRNLQSLHQRPLHSDKLQIGGLFFNMCGSNRVEQRLTLLMRQ